MCMYKKAALTFKENILCMCDVSMEREFYIFRYTRIYMRYLGNARFVYENIKLYKMNENSLWFH